ncbi:MAG: methyltransferase domain-containing protein [Candidatus Vogelbacteria bacterium]
MKKYFLSKLEPFISQLAIPRILDLGSGRSENFVELLKKFPNLHYVGIEPNKSDADIARRVLAEFNNAKIINDLAYKLPIEERDFDICISLSTLEHVKDLKTFLKTSVESVKSGGVIIHRYDLGHALHPSSFKERFQVFVGNNFPWLLPESKFVSYVDCNWVVKELEYLGAKVFQTTYHQMPNHKAFLKLFKQDTEKKISLANTIIEWEFAVSPEIASWPKKNREKLFPCLAVWAHKK